MGKRSKTKQRERRTYKKRAARLKKRAINEKEPDDTSLVEPDAEATANNDVQLLRGMTSDDFPNDTVSESSWIPSSPPSTPSSCDEPVPLSSSSLGLARKMSTLYDDEELPAIVIDKKRRIEVHIAPECTNMNGQKSIGFRLRNTSSKLLIKV